MGRMARRVGRPRPVVPDAGSWCGTKAVPAWATLGTGDRPELIASAGKGRSSAAAMAAFFAIQQWRQGRQHPTEEAHLEARCQHKLSSGSTLCQDLGRKAISIEAGDASRCAPCSTCHHRPRWDRPAMTTTSPSPRGLWRNLFDIGSVRHQPRQAIAPAARTSAPLRRVSRTTVPASSTLAWRRSMRLLDADRRPIWSHLMETRRRPVTVDLVP